MTDLLHTLWRGVRGFLLLDTPNPPDTSPAAQLRRVAEVLTAEGREVDRG